MLQAGRALVLPGFQLSPSGALAAIRAAGRRASAELAALQAAVDIITAGGERGRGGDTWSLHCCALPHAEQQPTSASGQTFAWQCLTCTVSLQSHPWQMRASSRCGTRICKGGRRRCRTAALPAARRPRCRSCGLRQASGGRGWCGLGGVGCARGFAPSDTNAA